MWHIQIINALYVKKAGKNQPATLEHEIIGLFKQIDELLKYGLYNRDHDTPKNKLNVFNTKLCMLSYIARTYLDKKDIDANKYMEDIFLSTVIASKVSNEKVLWLIDFLIKPEPSNRTTGSSSNKAVFVYPTYDNLKTIITNEQVFCSETLNFDTEFHPDTFMKLYQSCKNIEIEQLFIEDVNRQIEQYKQRPDDQIFYIELKANVVKQTNYKKTSTIKPTHYIRNGVTEAYPSLYGKIYDNASKKYPQICDELQVATALLADYTLTNKKVIVLISSDEKPCRKAAQLYLDLQSCKIKDKNELLEAIQTNFPGPHTTKNLDGEIALRLQYIADHLLFNLDMFSLIEENAQTRNAIAYN